MNRWFPEILDLVQLLKFQVAEYVVANERSEDMVKAINGVDFLSTDATAIEEFAHIAFEVILSKMMSKQPPEGMVAYMQEILTRKCLIKTRNVSKIVESVVQVRADPYSLLLHRVIRGQARGLVKMRVGSLAILQDTLLQETETLSDNRVWEFRSTHRRNKKILKNISKNAQKILLHSKDRTKLIGKWNAQIFREIHDITCSIQNAIDSTKTFNDNVFTWTQYSIKIYKHVTLIFYAIENIVIPWSDRLDSGLD